MNAEALYRRAIRLLPGQQPPVGRPYIISDDPRRGMRVIGLFDYAGKHTVYNVQMLPDAYFDLTKHMREKDAARSSVRRNAAGALPFINIPQSVAQNVFSKDGDGRTQLDARDTDERDKRLKRLANDRDFYKLRTSEGAV